MSLWDNLDAAAKTARIVEQVDEEGDAFGDLPDAPRREQTREELRTKTIWDPALGFKTEKFEARVKSHYKIAYKETGALVTWGPELKANPPQLRLVKLILRLAKKGGPVRIIVLKDRKVGISTGVDIVGLEMAMQLPWDFGIIANSDESTDTLFQIARTAYEHLPPDQRVEYRSIRDNRLQFGQRSMNERNAGNMGHKGSVQSRTAGGNNPFTSKTIQFLHLSECAKYDDIGDEAEQQKFILSAMGAVPKVGPSFVIAESTANGQQGWFYNTWTRAMESRSNLDGSRWYPYFVSWLDDPFCRADIPQGYDWDEWYSINPEDEERETQLVVKYGANQEQILFRRNQIYNECANDPDIYDQEFPTTADGAFLASGRPGIAKRVLDKQASSVKPPLMTYDVAMGEEPIQPLDVRMEEPL